MFCDDGCAYSPVIIDIDLRYHDEVNTQQMEDVKLAIEDWCRVMFQHLNVQAATDELNVQVTTCSDFPLRQDKDVMQADGGIATETIWKNGIHLYIPDIVADRRKLLEIRNSAYQSMGDRFQNTANDADSKIDSCIYKKNGILLAGSSKREQNRSAYKLTTTWKLTWTTNEDRLVFNFTEYPTSLVSKRDFLHKTILRVPSSDLRKVPVKIPILLENEIVCNKVNWDTKQGTFVYKWSSEYAAVVFKCLPTSLNKKFNTQYLVLRSTKAMQGSNEHVYEIFVEQSKIEYLGIEKKTRREY